MLSLCVKTLAAALALGVAAALSAGPALAAEKHYHFNLAPGASAAVPLPATLTPIRIDIAESSLNHGVQQPASVFSALVSLDPSSGYLSWVGTNNDGTQQGSNALATSTIATEFCGGGCVLSQLNAAAPGQQMVVLSLNSATTIRHHHYDVTLHY